jgi:hypothetical protein
MGREALERENTLAGSSPAKATEKMLSLQPILR